MSQRMNSVEKLEKILNQIGGDAFFDSTRKFHKEISSDLRVPIERDAGIGGEYTLFFGNKQHTFSERVDRDADDPRNQLDAKLERYHNKFHQALSDYKTVGLRIQVPNAGKYIICSPSESNTLPYSKEDVEKVFDTIGLKEELERSTLYRNNEHFRAESLLSVYAQIKGKSSHHHLSHATHKTARRELFEGLIKSFYRTGNDTDGIKPAPETAPYDTTQTPEVTTDTANKPELSLYITDKPEPEQLKLAI